MGAGSSGVSRGETEARATVVAREADVRAHRRGEAGAAAPGCLWASLGFTVCGAFFLWMFFDRSGGRYHGNPYMALVAGVLFAFVGLAGLYGSWVSRRGRR